MFKTIKNQKGITLVELLAVMVIVGIIAAISIPAIGNLIENTRKDAFVATAQSIQDAARIVATQDAACNKTCTVAFDATATADTTVDGTSYIENMPSDVTDAYVVVTNTDGTVTYATTYATANYELAVDPGNALNYTRDDVTQTPAAE
ncbi:MAG: type II secretion system protein [Culicoidibacterales bacterium]